MGEFLVRQIKNNDLSNFNPDSKYYQESKSKKKKSLGDYVITVANQNSKRNRSQSNGFISERINPKSAHVQKFFKDHADLYLENNDYQNFRIDYETNQIQMGIQTDRAKRKRYLFNYIQYLLKG